MPTLRIRKLVAQLEEIGFEMDATEIAIADAPRENEIVVALALGVGGRPLHRVEPDA